jgi:hypothetical protein
MTHDLIDRMVRQANPVPDPKVLEPVASVLDLQRRTEVQTDNRIEMEPKGKPSKRHVWLAIAAIAVILIGALLLLRSQPEPQVVDQPVVTPTTTAAPVTTAEVITTTSQPADAVPAELLGVWYVDEGAFGISRLILHGNTYTMPPGAGGQISVTGELVQFSGDLTCPSLAGADSVTLREATGIYRWSVQGTTLTFTPVEPDDCSAREVALTKTPYTRNSDGQPDG